MADYMIEMKYSAQDFEGSTANESLKMFRGLIYKQSLPGSRYEPIFRLFEDVIDQKEKQLTLSTWLTVIETCRQGI